MKKSMILKYGVYIILIFCISFVLPRIISGSPLSYFQNDTYILNQSLPESTFNAFKEYYAPEKSLLVQFGIYLRNLAALDLGYSFYYRLPVMDLILPRLFWTFLLGGSSLLISSFVGIRLGIKTALSGRLSKFNMALAVGFQCLPVFLVAVFVQGFFAYYLKIFPSGGAYSVGFRDFGVDFVVDVLRHMALPLLTLVLCEISGIYILTYNSAKKISSEGYVRMAYYLNVDKNQIDGRFIFANIVPELLAKLNIQVIYAITGSIFAESIFAYPGLGQLLQNSVSGRDFPLIQGILLVCCFYALVVNLVFELLIKKNSERY